MRIYWGVNQGNPEQLRKIVKEEFSGPLDLVIDDASHMYSLTKTSFETLFPLLRPGGIYIIEDWAWAHWKDFVAPAHWAFKTELTRMVFDLVKATGTSEELISDLVVFEGFVAAMRANTELPQSTAFKLESFIHNRRRIFGLRSRSIRLTLSGLWSVASSHLRYLRRGSC